MKLWSILGNSQKLDGGAMFGNAPKAVWSKWLPPDPDNRVPLSCRALLADGIAGKRVLFETGIGAFFEPKLKERYGVVESEHVLLDSLTQAGFTHGDIDAVVLSHLHFDHAGGLLLADGSRAFPRATVVAQRAEWEIALGGNSRLVASYDQPEIQLVRDWGEDGAADGEREVLPGVSVVPTGGHSAGHQAIVVRGTGDSARTLAFFGDLCMRPWAANPRWVTAFDDFPLDSVEVKGELFRRAVEEDWLVALSHESRMPVGTLVPDRDRYRFEGL